MRQNTILRQARNHKLRVGRAAAALKAKSDEKGVPGKKPVVEKKGKKVVGVKKQKKPVVGKKAAATKKPAAEKKPAGKKPTTEEACGITVSYTHLTLPTTIGWCRSRWSPYH